MEVYKSGNGYRYGFLALYLALIGISVWGSINTNGLLKVLSVVMIGMWLSGLAGIFRYKITLGENYIERTYLYRRRILFKDVVQVIIESQQAFVVSSDAKLHISQEISNREQLLQILLKRLKPFNRAQINGDSFVISYLLNAAEDRSKTGDGLASNQQLFSVSAKLCSKRWLIREFEVSTPSGVQKVTYYGQGLGYECVLVNGSVVDKKNSGLWYVPEFQFQIGDFPAKIKIRVWPWFAIKSFTFEVANKVVYQEG